MTIERNSHYKGDDVYTHTHKHTHISKAFKEVHRGKYRHFLYFITILDKVLFEARRPSFLPSKHINLQECFKDLFKWTLGHQAFHRPVPLPLLGGPGGGAYYPPMGVSFCVCVPAARSTPTKRRGEQTGRAPAGPRTSPHQNKFLIHIHMFFSELYTQRKK